MWRGVLASYKKTYRVTGEGERERRGEKGEGGSEAIRD
jgi:hypothetical protein